MKAKSIYYFLICCCCCLFVPVTMLVGCDEGDIGAGISQAEGERMDQERANRRIERKKAELGPNYVEEIVVPKVQNKVQRITVTEGSIEGGFTSPSYRWAEITDNNTGKKYLAVSLAGNSMQYIIMLGETK